MISVATLRFFSRESVRDEPCDLCDFLITNLFIVRTNKRIKDKL